MESDDDERVSHRRKSSKRVSGGDNETSDAEQPSKWAFNRSRAIFIACVIIAIIGLIYMYGYDMSEFKIGSKKNEWDVEAEVESLLQYQNQLLQAVK